MKIFEDKEYEHIQDLIVLSAEWKKENITYGYVCNDTDDIKENRVFVVTEDNTVIAYLFGKKNLQKISHL